MGNERITHASVKTKCGMVLLGRSHADCFHQGNNTGLELSSKPDDQGFFTSHGRFVSRAEGAGIAFSAGQTLDQKHHLFSEDLWCERDGGRFDYNHIDGYHERNKEEQG